MKLIFADTFYWVALINDRDDWHARVIAISSILNNVKVITTDEVLIEV
jgi:predicted nucleic acid-binding protein